MSTPPSGETPEEGREQPAPGEPGWDVPSPPPGEHGREAPPPPPGEQGGGGAPPPGEPGAPGQPAAGGWGSDPQGYGYAQVREHAPGAVASLVLGILGLFTIPLILSIIAVVLGNQSKRAAAAEPQRYNDQLGQVGRILGWIGIGLAIAGVLVLVLVFLALFPMRVS